MYYEWVQTLDETKYKRMVIKMKKSISLMLAVILAAISICTFAMSVFADTPNDDPDDGRIEPSSSSTTSTTAPTSSSTTSTTKDSSETSTSTTQPTTSGTTTKPTAADVTVTRDPSNTVIDDGTTAPSSTKKPAVVDTNIPSTGSGIIVPAIALLALAAGTVAVIKTKKED